MRARNVTLLLAGSLLIISGLVITFQRAALKKLTIQYENISQVSVYKSSSLSAGATEPRPVAIVHNSGETLELAADDYTLRYDASEGYESSFVEVALFRDLQSVTLRPVYSEAKLDSILKTEMPAIIQTLHATYPKLAVYNIQSGKLYEKGEWYGTTLVYKGDDYFNSDTLRVVLHKESGRWVIKTNPPGIILDKITYPGIPTTILRKVNSL